MRFHHEFTRRVGGGDQTGVAPLGSDEAPAGDAYQQRDNVLAVARCDINGFPVQRVVVGLIGPAAVRATMYAHDELTGLWFRVDGSTKELEPGVLAAFDVPSLMEARPKDGSRSPCVVALVAEGGAGTAEGDYRFLLGADVSSPGL